MHLKTPITINNHDSNKEYILRIYAKIYKLPIYFILSSDLTTTNNKYKGKIKWLRLSRSHFLIILFTDFAVFLMDGN